MELTDILIAFSLTLFAGLSTGIGSLLAFFTKKTNTKFLSIALGFSAGVMIYVSMIEIFVKAKESLILELGVVLGNWVTVASFFGGIFLIAIIDRLIPSSENPHASRLVEEMDEAEVKKSNLARMGKFTALAVAIHNFPEGLATFVSALQDPSLGIAIAFAVAIHNIPEGIAVSIPLYFATGDKKKAFLLSFLSGLAEPVGAIVGYFLLFGLFKDTGIFMGVIFGAVAGIMVFISLDELLPTAREYEETHLSIYGLIAGMMVMAVSLLLFI